MTHYELLEKIETLHAQGSNPGTRTNPTYDSMYAFENALKAVVELHRRLERPKWLPIEFQGYSCNICPGNYPCKTIQTIESALQ
jgi:hypothetical protein